MPAGSAQVGKDFQTTKDSLSKLPFPSIGKGIVVIDDLATPVLAWDMVDLRFPLVFNMLFSILTLFSLQYSSEVEWCRPRVIPLGEYHMGIPPRSHKKPATVGVSVAKYQYGCMIQSPWPFQ